MFTRIRNLLTVKVGIVASVLLLSAGAAVAATGDLGELFATQQAAAENATEQVPEPADGLPDQAVAGQEHAAELAGNAEEFTQTVRDTIDEYLVALRDWTTCVSDNASSRGTLQSDPATQTQGAFDPTEGCDARPELDLPAPGDFGLDGDGESDLGGGPPDNVPLGPPEDAGSPPGLPGGPDA